MPSFKTLSVHKLTAHEQPTDVQAAREPSEEVRLLLVDVVAEVLDMNEQVPPRQFSTAHGTMQLHCSCQTHVRRSMLNPVWR